MRYTDDMWKTFILCLLYTVLSVAAHGFELEIKVVPGQLIYDVDAFDAPAGAEAVITFNNTGFISHNLLFCSKGDGVEKVFLNAMNMGAQGMQTGFVPPGPEVLSASRLLNPGDKQVMKFKIPEESGDYGFICTFPGHGNRMRGVMRVVPAGQPLREVQRKDVETYTGPTSLPDTEVTPFPEGSIARPMVLRTFMPDIGFDEDLVLANHQRGLPAKGYSPSTGKDTGGTVNPIRGLPAAFALGYGNALSVCWDTVECRILYAWTGGFLDMTKYWGKGRGGGRKRFGYIPELIGSVIYHADTAHPLRLTSVNELRSPKYLGYQVVNHVPEFIYQLGASYVQVRITPGDDGQSFKVRYIIHGANEPVFYVAGEALRTRITTDSGRWNGSTLEIDPATAKAGFELVVAFGEPVEMSMASGVNHGGPGLKLGPFISEGEILAKVDRFRSGKLDTVAAILPGGLKNDQMIYLDREYRFKSVPKSLVGADMVQTYNNDKKGGGVVEYAVTFKDDATLMVLVDTRVGAPWLKGPDGKNVKLRKSSVGVATDFEFAFVVYAVNVGKGTYRIGPQTDASFYSIAARKGHLKELSK